MSDDLLASFRQSGLKPSANMTTPTSRKVSPAWTHVSDSEEEGQGFEAQASALREQSAQCYPTQNRISESPAEMSTKVNVARARKSTTWDLSQTEPNPRKTQRRLTVITLDDSSDEQDQVAPARVRSSAAQVLDESNSDSSIEIITPSKPLQKRSKALSAQPRREPARSSGPPRRSLAPASFHINGSQNLPVLPSIDSISPPLSAQSEATSSKALPPPLLPAPELYAEPPEQDLSDDGAFLEYIPSSKTKPSQTPRKPAAAPQLALTTSAGTSKPAASSHRTTCKEGKFSILSPAKRSRKSLASDFGSSRDRLCLELVQELDALVFHGRLPDGLDIIWSKRLNTTAGRAKWKRSREATTGQWVHDASIELSTKVVDTAQKLQNTLSHELAHVMSWVVENELKPPHGPAFKRWSESIMRARPDILITTRHRYSISYKYSWICTVSACGQVYGRHSKSIDPSRQACACGGTLKAL